MKQSALTSKSSGGRRTGWIFRFRLHSPLRRIVQAAAFIVFALLVFWVSWPHDAQPDVVRDEWPATGALFSIVSTLRLVERKAGPSCTGCGVWGMGC